MKNNKILAGNMKMNLTKDETLNFINEIKSQDLENVIIFPTSIYANYFLDADINVGLQKTYIENSGAYTGEISPSQAYSMGIRYTLVGHSERRTIFKETDIDIRKQLLLAISNNLKPVFCIGETKEERDLLKTNIVLKRQIINTLKDLEKDMYQNIYIAYEPVWAIGTGLVPTTEDIEANIEYIKKIVKELTDIEIPVWYGGSVSPSNIKELKEIHNVDGFLVGGASTKAETFIPLIKEV